MVPLLKWHLLTGERISISRAVKSTLFTGTKLMYVENTSSVIFWILGQIDTIQDVFKVR